MRPALPATRSPDRYGCSRCSGPGTPCCCTRTTTPGPPTSNVSNGPPTPRRQSPAVTLNVYLIAAPGADVASTVLPLIRDADSKFARAYSTIRQRVIPASSSGPTATSDSPASTLTSTAWWRTCARRSASRTELPESIVVSVSQCLRATVEQFHARRLELAGDGEWRLERLTTGVKTSAPPSRPARYLATVEEGMFVPTLDWGNELLASLRWIGQAWVIAAVAHAGDPRVLIARYTVWGRQFWRITGDYFKGPESVKVWLWLAVILLSVIVGVRLSVLFTLPGQRHDDQLPGGGVGRWPLATTPSRTPARTASTCRCSCSRLLAVLHVARIMLDLFITQRFMLAWRVWLTDRLTGDWLDGKAYYRGRFIDDTIDNPDQRIQQDIDIFTAGVGGLPNTPNNTSTATLLFGSVNAIASMISFTAILWNLSGTLTLPIVDTRGPQGHVLDPADLRALCLGHRVLGRPADHLAVVQQREVQRGLPLCAGAAARRVGGGRVLPRRNRRAHRAAQALRARSSPTTSGTSTG